MMTLAALVALVLGIWGVFEISADIHDDRRQERVPTVSTRAADLFWLVGMACIAVTAVHSLAASWF